MTAAARIKPRALCPGDKIGIVAPASDIKRELLEAGGATLRRLGYEPVYSASILQRDLYFAGSVERRSQELQGMFEREDIRAIVCARGGYGSNYLLPKINIKAVAAHPKIFVGYSDNTSLATYFTDAAGLVTFHGPMATKDFAVTDGFDFDSWSAAVSGASEWEIGEGSGAITLAANEAEGTLYGGCLSMLVASLGTPYEIQTDDVILFVEDVAAKPYQIDRMLMQLKLAGKFRAVRALVFGEMLNCRQGPDQDYTLEEVVMRVVGDLNIPVAFGLRSGHVSRANITLPMGVRVRLEAGQKVRLRILEAATVI